jgi:hypothetical protein
MTFEKIETKEDFEEFVNKNTKENLSCIVCRILTKDRGLYINGKLNAIYPLCSNCQKKCLESKQFSMLVSDKVKKVICKENN